MSVRLRCLAALSATLLALVPLAHTACQGTCQSSADCGATEFCALPDGDCLTSKALGFCKTRPDGCSPVLTPVCACDGKSYDNSCEAAKHGSPVAGTGVCGAACGGPTQAKCETGDFCDLDPGACGAATPNGTCKAPPNTCPQVLSPVCGCDGTTYQNGCLAAKASVSVLATGPCPCGGPTTITCGPGAYCEFPVATCLGPSPAGTCVAPPASCAPAKSAICGCDSKTYDNACEAAKLGISVATMKACVTSGH